MWRANTFKVLNCVTLLTCGVEITQFVRSNCGVKMHAGWVK